MRHVKESNSQLLGMKTEQYREMKLNNKHVHKTCKTKCLMKRFKDLFLPTTFHSTELIEKSVSSLFRTFVL